MIRFEPDTWRDALLRPIAMAAPDAGVYIEIMAPDFRFAVAIVLIVLLAILALWRKLSAASLKPTAILLVIMTVAFWPWLNSSGNGRYFIAFLLAVGPLCIALVYLLPLTRGFRLTLAACVVAVQAFVVFYSDPVKFWGLSQWREPPYFQLDLPQDLATVPATYVTLSSISYSLVAPLFPAASSWINIASATTDRENTMQGRRIHALLSSGKPLTLLVPTIPEYATSQGLPDAEIVRSITLMLADHRIALSNPAQCRMLRSGGLASTPSYKNRRPSDSRFELAGFWVCPLRYPVAAPAARPDVAMSQFDAVFDKVETLCPRFFRPGEARTKIIRGGELRQYAESDMKVYVMNDGVVLYKYLRTFSAERIGTMDEVMSGKATVDCTKIRGRSGLPWEREI